MKKRRKHSYTNYDYDSYFDSNLEQANDAEIKKLLDKGFIKSVYATKTIKSGNIFEVEIYPEFTRKQAKIMKLPKVNKSIKNLNLKNSRKRLERLINTNFTECGFHITLTYSNKHLPKSIEEAEKNMVNFIRKLNYRRKKNGLKNAKYIFITEYSEEKKIRVHHHLIIDGDVEYSIKELNKIWDKGNRNEIRQLDPDENGLTGLAKYLAKDPKGKKRWRSSKNLKKPVERKSYTRFKNRDVEKIVNNFGYAQIIATKKYRKTIQPMNSIFTGKKISEKE